MECFASKQQTQPFKYKYTCNQLTRTAPHPAQLVDWYLRYLDLLGRFEKVTQGPRGSRQGRRGI